MYIVLIYHAMPISLLSQCTEKSRNKRRSKSLQRSPRSRPRF